MFLLFRRRHCCGVKGAAAQQKRRGGFHVIQPILCYNYISTSINVTYANAEDVGSTTTMLEHLKRKHPGALSQDGTVRCGSVTPWSVCATCLGPPLISLFKDKSMLLCYLHAGLTGSLVKLYHKLIRVCRTLPWLIKSDIHTAFELGVNRYVRLCVPLKRPMHILTVAWHDTSLIYLTKVTEELFKLNISRGSLRL